MKRWTNRRVLGLVLCLSFVPVVSWAASSECSEQTWIAPGQHTVTPAIVTGAPLERLPLHGDNPAGGPFESNRPDGGFLVTGNKVDLVTTCAGFAYVRFHGPKRMSTGWVDAARVKVMGPEHGTLPRDAPMLCRAAEKTLNAGQLLAVPNMSRLDSYDVLTRVHLGPFPNASPPEVAHIVVNGRRMAALIVDDGGTSHDTSVYVFSNDLSSLLSPPDRDDRDVENNGADDWGFGVSEDIVIVSGQPMVRSTGRPYGKWPVYLSIIDRDGDIVPTCEIKKEPLKERLITRSIDSRVCHAMLAGQQLPAPMHPPAPGESLVLEKVPRRFSTYGGRIHSTATQLNYHDTERAAGVRYTLIATGIADLDNSGHARRVGIVSFWEGDSTAGDGTYTDSKVFPVYLNEKGVADLSSETNMRLAGAMPHGMAKGELVTFDGTSYLELTPGKSGPSSEVWKINSTDANEVCTFRLTREVAHPITQ